MLAAANNSTILDDSFSEALPLSDSSSDEDEAEDINPGAANKRALIKPLLTKRKNDA